MHSFCARLCSVEQKEKSEKGLNTWKFLPLAPLGRGVRARWQNILGYRMGMFVDTAVFHWRWALPVQVLWEIHSACLYQAHRSKRMFDVGGGDQIWPGLNFTWRESKKEWWYRQTNHLLFNRSVVSDSLPPHGLQPARLLCSWDFPVKNTGVGGLSLVQRIFLTQGLNISCITARIFTAEPPGKPSPLLTFF